MPPQPSHFMMQGQIKTLGEQIEDERKLIGDLAHAKEEMERTTHAIEEAQRAGDFDRVKIVGQVHGYR